MRSHISLAAVRAFTARMLVLPLASLFLSNCSAPISVTTQRPVAPPGAPERQRDAGLQLAAVHDSYQRIVGGDESAVPAYNHAVARLIEVLEKSGADPWSAPLSLTGTGGIQRLTGRAPNGVHPLHDRLIPTDTLVFKGRDAAFQSIVSGIGAPLISVNSSEDFKHLAHEVHRKKLPVRDLTAIVRFEGNAATLELIDPYQVETVNLARRDRALAADFGAAVMFAMSKSREDKLGIARLLHPERYNDTVHLNFLQPYDPKRIPVLFIHGLDSTPATFAPMYLELLENRLIRERYQFWVFSYPSGYPYPYSASLLRKELTRVHQAFPDHKDMVLIGHSMGSLISRAMVTDAGERLWHEVFGKPVDQADITGSSRRILEETLVFDAQPKISRVIFCSGPHRGSELAVDWIGKLFGKLVRLPATMADMRDVIAAATIDPAAAHLTRAPNSIDTLAPDNYFVIGINRIPIKQGITYHTIAGDRGKGDSPHSSDGVVAYWSSHMKGAASEKIVPSGHGSHAHPEGIEEARRILKLHLQSLRQQ